MILVLAATGCAPSMVPLPAGVFAAGSVSAETVQAGVTSGQASQEQPQRTELIDRRFAIQRTEVTRGEFGRFVAATGWKPDGPCSWLADGPSNQWQADMAHGWRNPGFAQTDRHPVVCVSLADAEGYARWLSAKTGRRYRLPTGDEWEYAARAGTLDTRWWGKAAPCAFANVSDRSRALAHNRGIVDPAKFFDCEDGHVQTAPVASFKPNPWGLHDMLGNVWEWTSDCAPEGCNSHIDRGGSWTNSPRYLRAAARHPDKLGVRTSVLGFRLVEDLP